MRTASRSSTPQDGSVHKKAVGIRLLNKEQVTFHVDAKGKVNDLFNQVCDFLGLRETEYFGVASLVDEEFQFLNSDEKLSKHASKAWKQSNSGFDKCGKVLLTLHFRVQFYVDSVSLLRERVTRHQYYLQLRENLLHYGQPCSDDRYFMLSSYALQADLGKFNASRHTDNYFDPREYFPAWIVDEHGEDYAQRHMPSLHEDLRAMSKTEAQLQYIREASTRPCHFNLHLYRLKKKKNESPGSIWLGICARGIEIYEETSCTLMGLLSTYLWPDIGKLYFDKKKFEIRSVGSPENRKSTYYTGSDDRSKYLLALCRNTHVLHMAMQPKLMEIQNFEIEDRKRYQESYIFSDSSDLAWEQEQSLVQGSLSLHGYSTLPSRGSNDNRTSVISNTSSNTTSGIVSDRMHISFDESEDDRDGEIAVDEGRSSRESNNSAGRSQLEESPTSSTGTRHSPTNSESGKAGTRTDIPLTGPPLPPRLYDTRTVPSSGGNPSGGSSPHGSTSSSSQGFRRSGSGSSHGSRASTHSAKSTLLTTVQEQTDASSDLIKDHDYEHIYENLIPRVGHMLNGSSGYANTSVVSAGAPSSVVSSLPQFVYQPNDNTSENHVFVLPGTVPTLMPADHKLVISKPRMGVMGISTVRSGPVGQSGMNNQNLPANGCSVPTCTPYRYPTTNLVNGDMSSVTMTTAAQPGRMLMVNSVPVTCPSQTVRSSSAASKVVVDSYDRLVSAQGVINELRPRPPPPRNIYGKSATICPTQRKMNAEGQPWTPKIQITPTHSPTNSADSPTECAMHPNIERIRDLTQNMRLPLINALCNDKSLVCPPSDKRCTCQGSQNSLNHLRVTAARPDPKRLSASYAVNSPTAMQLSASARPMSWHSETFDLDKQLQLQWNIHHATSAAMLNPGQHHNNVANLYGSGTQLNGAGNNGYLQYAAGSTNGGGSYLHSNGYGVLQNGGGYLSTNSMGHYSQVNTMFSHQHTAGYSNIQQQSAVVNGYLQQNSARPTLVPRTNYNYMPTHADGGIKSVNGVHGVNGIGGRLVNGHGHHSE